jgi:LmbE family N-acetylglucosaminyl deacetylase
LRNFLKNLSIDLVYLFVSLFSCRARDFIFKHILILAPHPDDEILGLGGTLLKLLDAGTQVNIVYLTDGEISGIWHDREEIKKQRILLSGKVAKSLGIDNSNIHRLHLPDGSVPHPGQTGFEEAVKTVKEIIDYVKPDAVFATHPLDYWPFDHVACAEIATGAIKLSEHKPQLWYYWVWAWYNLRPWKLSVRRLKKLQKVDISKQLPRNKELMDIYLASFTPDGKPWSGVLPASLIMALRKPLEIVEKMAV